MWYLTSENIFFFLGGNFLCTSNSGLPYSFSEMVNIYMTVLEYHILFFHVDIGIGISILQAKTFCIINPVFPFFGGGNFLRTSNPGFPYSFSEWVNTDLCDFVFMNTSCKNP